MPHWWEGHPAERFWCEITDRADPGRLLACPRTDPRGERYWSYEMILLVRPGDVVFHFSPARGEVVGASAAGGPCEEAPVRWPRRSEDLFEAEVLGWEDVPGWRRPLRGFRRLETPVTLEMLREGMARAWHSEWWEARSLEGLRPIAHRLFPRRLPSALGYLLKVPADFVARWPALLGLAHAVEGTGGAPSDAPRNVIAC